MRSRNRRRSKALDYLLGIFLTIAVLIFGALVSVDIPLGDTLSLFERGDGALSDAMYALSILYIPALFVFACMFTYSAYSKNRKRRFYGMEIVLAVSSVSAILVQLLIPQGGATNVVFGIAGVICMFLSAPLYAVAYSAADGIITFGELEISEVPWLYTVFGIVLILVPIVAGTVWAYKRYDEGGEHRARKKKRR